MGKMKSRSRRRINNLITRKRMCFSNAENYFSKPKKNNSQSRISRNKNKTKQN